MQSSTLRDGSGNRELEISGLAYDLWQNAGGPAGRFMEYREKARQDYASARIGPASKPEAAKLRHEAASPNGSDTHRSAWSKPEQETRSSQKRTRPANETARIARQSRNTTRSSRTGIPPKTSASDMGLPNDRISRDEIARVAYGLWQHAGRPFGRYAEFLTRVERNLASKVSGSADCTNAEAAPA